MAESSIADDIIHKLSTWDDASLRMIWEYYREDLDITVQNVDTAALLSRLQSDYVLNTEKYQPMRDEWKTSTFSSHLLEDISELGREAVIGFWTCLWELQKERPHPNFLAVQEEIQHTGDDLVQKILLDEHGHPLPAQLRDIQEQHKQHLLERHQTLVEHRPPASTLGEQSFLINERYVHLVVVSTVQFRQRSQNELLETGRRHEEYMELVQTGLEHISPSRLFRWSPQSQCIPHAVMVSGVPGIGKTTLMQKIVYDWLTGKLYQRFAFVFLYRFRELNKLAEVSLEEMILHKDHGYPYLEGHLGGILCHPERLLFIFDGLDESIHQIDFTSSKLSSHPKQRGDVGVIVGSLVSQGLLKGCSVLMTSRPTRLASVDTSVFQRVTEILGFPHADRLAYFELFFRNKKLAQKAFQHVQENDTLYTFCYIPTYCWIICTVLSMCYRNQPANTDQLVTPLPKTVTQLFVAFVSNILANHSQNRDDPHIAQELLTSLGWMAEHGVMNHVIVFDKRDLETFRVTSDKHLFSCFMMESGQPPDVDYSFLHLTLQEFFAALAHFISFNPDKLAESLKKAILFEDGRAEIFLRFLCGLSDSATRSMLRSYVGELSPQASRQVITWLQQNITERLRHVKDEHSTRRLFNLFHCLYESRNKALVSQCVGSHKLIDFAHVRLTPLDCSVVSYILQYCTETKVNLPGCLIPDEGLRKLVPALKTIRNLSLGNNNLPSSSCPHLASGVRNNQTLRILDLSDNRLGGDEFSVLMAALPTSRIEELLLHINGLPSSSCPHLASGIRNNKTLRMLELSYNKLGGPELSVLMEALPTSQIEELHLKYNDLPPSCCPHLASGIRNNPTLRWLDLSYNRLGGPEFGVLMAALTTSRIEELLLENNDLPPSCCPHLASGIRNNQTLRKLHLSYNSLGGDEFSALMAALPTSRIEELLLQSINVSSSCCPHLASGIRNNQTLRWLDLSYNRLWGPEFGDLMAVLPTSQIKELVLQGNNLSSSCCPHLASGIRNNQNLRMLHLTGNKLGGPEFSDLMEALPTSQIEELHVHIDDLPLSCCPHLASRIRNNLTENQTVNMLGGPAVSVLLAALPTSRKEELSDLMAALPTSQKEKLYVLLAAMPTSWIEELSVLMPTSWIEKLSVLMATLPTSWIEKFGALMATLTTSQIEKLSALMAGLPTSWIEKFGALMATLRTSQIEELSVLMPTSWIEKLSVLMATLPTSWIEKFGALMATLTTSQIEKLSALMAGLPRSWMELICALKELFGLKPDLPTSWIEKFSVLMAALPTSRIEELLLQSNDLHSSSCPHLASGIRNNQTVNLLGGPESSVLMEVLTTCREDGLHFGNPYEKHDKEQKELEDLTHRRPDMKTEYTDGKDKDDGVN
ncbi:NACHT, LRR and PYD domains-containing protein 3-like isoform X3 [Hyperolius riggenbachi]|uniref:NACHT, LRR and PYD domains-containing protein 3-like isoform X3 n=1 Tax=Hyperolius riggenbachi TaxID=752182 RepID=UPI0035A38DF1